MQLLNAENIRESKRYFCNTTTLSCATAIRWLRTSRYASAICLATKLNIILMTKPKNNSYFGEAYVPQNLHDKARLKKMINRLGVELELPYLGRTFLFWECLFLQLLSERCYVSGVLQRRQIKDTDLSLGVQWHKRVGGFQYRSRGWTEDKMTGTRLSGKLLMLLTIRTASPQELNCIRLCLILIICCIKGLQTV